MKNVELGLDIIREIRKLNDDNINIKEATIIINGDTFEIIKPANRKYEYTVTVNGEYIKCAEDNTLCRNNGRCLNCGYCL